MKLRYITCSDIREDIPVNKAIDLLRISSENVIQNLDKIAKVAGNRTDIWIDAEGKLKTPGTKTFDINRAKQYINAAICWQQKQK